MHSQPQGYRCPACDGVNVKYLGKIKGRPGIIDFDEESSLYECNYCTLLYRYPYVDERMLQNVYRNVTANSWDEGERPDYELAKKYISRDRQAREILDVGCYTGRFLSELPLNLNKCGIEASSFARNIAKEKGINLVGSKIEDLQEVGNKFDIITAFDVVEHLKKPLEAFRMLGYALKKGGILVITTGNTDTWAWRMARTDYWYYFPDHVSFFNPRWFRWAVGETSGMMKVEIVKRFSHYTSSAVDRWKQALRFLAFNVESSIEGKWWVNGMRRIYPIKKMRLWTNSPSTHLQRDHMLVVMRRSL